MQSLAGPRLFVQISGQKLNGGGQLVSCEQAACLPACPAGWLAVHQ